jgi:hypothetical protein
MGPALRARRSLTLLGVAGTLAGLASAALVPRAALAARELAVRVAVLLLTARLAAFACDVALLLVVHVRETALARPALATLTAALVLSVARHRSSTSCLVGRPPADESGGRQSVLIGEPHAATWLTDL